MLARTVFFVLLGPSIVLLSCSKDRPAPAAPAGKSLASLAAPAAPTNLRFDAPTDSSCTVRWDASDGATDYDVNYKPAVGGRWTNEPHRGIGLSNTIHDLQPNTEYRWAVRAENSDGPSAWVFGPNFTTLADSVATSAGAPDPPTNLRIDQLTATSVRVRWDASDGATDYDVNYKAVGGRWTNEPHKGTPLYNTIEGLEPNTEYQWAVRAENSAGPSTWVHADNFTTLPDSTSSSDSSSASSPDSSSPSDEVFIPDAALRRYIEKVLRKRPGETITQGDMNTLQSLLQGNHLGIESLTGLETANNLRNLAIGGNDISDLTPLVNLANLRYLHIKNTPFLNEVSINEHIPALQSRGVTVELSPYHRTFPESPFNIDLVFLDDFTEKEQELCHIFAKRWAATIQSELPDYTFSHAWSSACGEHSIKIPAGERIDDLRIYITKFDEIDPYGRRVGGYGGPWLLRSSSLPIIGCIGLNYDVGLVLHEIGHVLGIGTIWDSSGMLRGLNADTHFAGPQAIAAFNQAGGTDYQGAKVPTEQDGAHWRGSVLPGELMSTRGGIDALSAITLQALSGLGYSVDLSAADAYKLPSRRSAKPVADAVPFCSLEGLPPPVYVDDD